MTWEDDLEVRLSVLRRLARGEVVEGDYWISDKGKFGTHEILDEISPAEKASIDAWASMGDQRGPR